jgi:hypothetical protein
VINTVGSRPVDVLCKGCVCKEDLIRAGARRDVLIALGTASGDHARSRTMRKLNRASANRSRATLHQHRSPFDGASNVNCTMRGYTGNSETGTLFHGHAVDA